MLSIRAFKTPSTLRQELRRFNDTDPVLHKDIWSGLRDPLQLLAGGHRSNEEACLQEHQEATTIEETVKQSRSMSGPNTIRISGMRQGSFTVQATPPPC